MYMHRVHSIPPSNLPSRSHYPRNFSHFVFPTATTSTQAPTPVWIDKLSLATYDIQTITPAAAPQIRDSTNSQQQLSVITSTKNTTNGIRSAFPKTPGTLRCSDTHCRTRIPVTSGLATTIGLRERPLCEEHSEQFFDAEEHLAQTERNNASPKSDVISEIIGSYQHSSAESRWGSIDMSGARRPGLRSRTSSSASWRSLASWESDDAEFEWDARAFDSKLCW